MPHDRYCRFTVGVPVSECPNLDNKWLIKRMSVFKKFISRDFATLLGFPAAFPDIGYYIHVTTNLAIYSR